MPSEAGVADTPEASDFASIQHRLADYLKQRNQRDETLEKRLQDQAKQLPADAPNGLPVTIPQAPLMPLYGGTSSSTQHLIHRCTTDLDPASDPSPSPPPSPPSPPQPFIAFTLQDYLQLVEETGRAVREDKTGFIDNSLPTLLTRFGLAPETWIKCVKNYGCIFSNYAGDNDSMRSCKMTHSYGWLKGQNSALSGRNKNPGRNNHQAA